MRRTLPLDSAPASICVLRLSAIGDVCHTLAVVRTLQRTWPRTRLTWIIGKIEAALVADIAGIEFIVYDKRSGREGLSALRRQLRGRRFDVLLQMQAALRASRVARHVPADIRLGFDRARAQDFQWLFTTHRIAAQPRPHVIDGLFGFAEALGVRQRILAWNIPLSDADRRYAAARIPQPGRALVISPLASEGARGARNWPAERFAAVADHACARHGLQVLLTGGSSARERESGAAIVAAMRQPVVNVIGETSLKQLLALLARARVLLAPDSGPAHMATAVGTPVISLFAGTNPDRAAPYFSREWVVSRYREALLADCGKTVDQVRWGRRVRDPKAMERISVAEVTDMLDRVMAENR